MLIFLYLNKKTRSHTQTDSHTKETLWSNSFVKAIIMVYLRSEQNHIAYVHLKKNYEIKFKKN